ncbi:MAG: DUF302 domain-containing protein [Caldilineaceae bacterium]|nr:DUF302 domain-containing protein [Caldilineaceae bacterium]
MSNEYGMRQSLSMNYADAIPAVKAALKEEGFGVLTEIDVKATMKQKLDEEYKPYIILGACNPNLAHKGLQAEPELGLLLPCNVIVYDAGDDTSVVSIVDPMIMVGVAENSALQEMATEANARLTRVLESLQE